MLVLLIFVEIDEGDNEGSLNTHAAPNGISWKELTVLTADLGGSHDHDKVTCGSVWES